MKRPQWSDHDPHQTGEEKCIGHHRSRIVFPEPVLPVAGIKRKADGRSQCCKCTAQRDARKPAFLAHDHQYASGYRQSRCDHLPPGHPLRLRKDPVYHEEDRRHILQQQSITHTDHRKGKIIESLIGYQADGAKHREIRHVFQFDTKQFGRCQSEPREENSGCQNGAKNKQFIRLKLSVEHVLGDNAGKTPQNRGARRQQIPPHQMRFRASQVIGCRFGWLRTAQLFALSFS